MITEDETENQTMSPSNRYATLQSLVPVAMNLTATQLEGFTIRLSEALFRLSDQSIRPEEASISAQSYTRLKKNTATFCRLACEKLAEELTHAVNVLQNGEKPKPLEDNSSLSLVTFDEMENKVLLESLNQAIEVDNADELVRLNLRIGHLLQIEQIHIKHNPFRPAVFLNAIYQAWCDFEPVSESHHLVLRVLRPEIFIQLNPVLRELNNALIERGILPKAQDLYRVSKHYSAAEQTVHNADKTHQGTHQGVSDRPRGDPFFESKIKGILYANHEQPTDTAPMDATQAGFQPMPYTGSQNYSPSGDASTEQGTAGNNGSANRPEMVTIDRQFFEYLTGIQGNVIASGPTTQVANTLHNIVQQAPQNTITQIDSNTIGLLAQIFDYVFSDPDIPADLKNLIGQLQIPTLKAALIDREFFFKQTHPARVLIDTLAKSSITWNPEKGVDDPLYQMIAKTVDRVQKEFDQQLDLFTDAAADLTQFIEEEEKLVEQEIRVPIAKAVKQEKIRHARESAMEDVTTRIETGEVAGFIEEFLEQRWVDILALAHSVKEKKPRVLERTRKTMDELIWSVKTKNSVEERNELVTKLPALLSSLNKWLNSIKWEDPSRITFFSKLAERHANIARTPPNVTSRQQVEIAVNVAQKAIERSLNKSQQENIFPDQFVFFVDQMERGTWYDFTQEDDSVVRYKLAWVSPKRSRFIFTNRQGHNAFSISSEELIDIFRSGKAEVINDEPMVDRALQAAIDARE